MDNGHFPAYDSLKGLHLLNFIRKNPLLYYKISLAFPLHYIAPSLPLPEKNHEIESSIHYEMQFIAQGHTK